MCGSKGPPTDCHGQYINEFSLNCQPPFRVLSPTSKDVFFIAVTAPSSLDQTLRSRETEGGRKGSGEIEGDRGRSWDLEIGGAIEGK